MSAGAVAVALAALGGLLAVGPGPDPAGLARRLRRDPPRGAAASGIPADGGARPPAWLGRVAAVAAVLALLTGRIGAASVLGALALAVGLPAAQRSRAEARAGLRLARDLPRAADLLATCLDAGATPVDALATVAEAVGGPLAVRFVPVAAALTAGSDLGGWATGPDDPASRLLRAVARTGQTGAPLAAAVRDLASDERDRARSDAQERARRAGVQAVGPLAACFLPAFVLVGVAPVVVGVARTLLAGWP